MESGMMIDACDWQHIKKSWILYWHWRKLSNTVYTAIKYADTGLTRCFLLLLLPSRFSRVHRAFGKSWNWSQHELFGFKMALNDLFHKSWVRRQSGFWESWPVSTSSLFVGVNSKIVFSTVVAFGSNCKQCF